MMPTFMRVTGAGCGRPRAAPSPQARQAVGVASPVKGRTRLDAGQAILKQAGAHLQRFLKQSEKTRRQVEKTVGTAAQRALVKGAGTLRRRADDLQASLEKLSGRLARLERRKAAPAKRRSRQAAATRRRPVPTARTRRPARPKKAA